MTDNTQSGSDINVTRKDMQELDEIRDLIYDLAYDHLTGSAIAIVVDDIVARITDWHNKQIEAVLRRLEGHAFDIKQTIKVSQYPARSVYEPELIDAFSKVVSVERIKAERNKLKED